MGKSLLALTLLASASYGQSWEVGQSFAYLPQAGTIRDSRTPSLSEKDFAQPIPPPVPMPSMGPTIREIRTVRPTLRITASHQPLAALRAVTRERVPEGVALYSVAVCNLSQSAITLDARQVEQAIEAEGVAVMARHLAQATVNRSRVKSLGSALLRGEAAGAAGMALGSAKLTGAVSGLHPAIPIGLMALGWVANGISAASSKQREEALADLAQHGAWLADQAQMQLAPNGCSQRLSMLGSFTRGQKRTLVIEVE